MRSSALPKIASGFLIPGRPRATLRRGLLAVGAVLVLVAAGLVSSTERAGADPSYGAWGSGTLSPADLASLVAQMSPAEEVGMLHGYGDPPAAMSPVPSVAGEAGGIAGVPRLGIPPLRFTDGPAGIRLSHVETAMPAPVGLAATWDPSTASEYGSTVGDAGRATGEDVWLAPMINQVNFVTGGRNFETLGEDPYLASQLVGPEVQGVQGQGMIAEVKHYAENDFENGRTSTNVTIDDQTLHETELSAFETAIDAGAGAVMCSYNRINTIYSCGNDATLNGVLRGQLGFKGFVTSDWGAVHRVSDQLHGDNIEQPGNAAGTSAYGQQLLNALAGGTPAVASTADFPAEPAHSAADWKAGVDTSVLAILTEENNAGLLEGTQYGTHYDPTTHAPYVPPRPDLDSLRPIAAAIAQAIAEQSATLLKNNGALPLRQGDLSGNGAGNGVVVMGPTAIAPYVGGGGSAHVSPRTTPSRGHTTRWPVPPGPRPTCATSRATTWTARSCRPRRSRPRTPRPATRTGCSPRLMPPSPTSLGCCASRSLPHRCPVGRSRCSTPAPTPRPTASTRASTTPAQTRCRRTPRGAGPGCLPPRQIRAAPVGS
jgi:beta-glucosidase